MIRRVLLAAILLAVGFSAARAERLPSGTEMTIRLQTEVVPGSKNAEQFSALLSYPVFANGREVLPAGSRVEGEVRGSKKRIVLSPKYLILPDGKQVDFNAAVSEIDRERLRAEEREGTIEQSGGKGDAARQAAQIGLTGASVGAMATGSAKGMGIGAAAGVIAVLIGRKMAGRNNSTVIPAGTQLTLSLSRELDVPDNLAEARAPVLPRAADRDTRDPEDRRPILRRRD